MLKFKQFVTQILNEGGHAVSDARPITQAEIDKTYEYVVKNILPLVGITEDAIKPIGSFKKKAPDQTSGDIDIAVLVDAVAGANGIAMEDALQFIDDKLKADGHTTAFNKSLGQVSFGVPIEGKDNNGIAQIDFMLTDNLDWSTFMYHSPDFTKSESKYKGLYRNILLMKIIGNSRREVVKTIDTGETEEYEAYVLRLNQGIVKVRKTFMGKKGLRKNPELMKQFDKFITNAPVEVTDAAFGPGINPSDIMTFEDIWRRFTDPKFIHKDKFDSILTDFVEGIKQNKVPLPSEVVEAYPNLS
jgi:hypothetical protein